MRTDIGNGMVIGAAKAFERGQSPEVCEADTIEATERVLRDVDTFTDELAGNCSNTSTHYDRRALQVALVSAYRQDDVLCAMLMRIIIGRYLDRSADRIDKLAEQIAWERAADEAEQ